MGLENPYAFGDYSLAFCQATTEAPGSRKPSRAKQSCFPRAGRGGCSKPPGLKRPQLTQATEHKKAQGNEVMLESLLKNVLVHLNSAKET